MNIKPIHYLFLSLAALAIGVLFFAYQQKIIIINTANFTVHASTNNSAQKKQVSLVYWHHNRWQTEQIYLLFTNDHADNIQLLANRWLSLVHAEKIIKKKVIVQATLLGYDGKTLFLSFDRAPWNKDNSTYEKWMNIEGLLKTIKNTFTSIKQVCFLCHHQPLQDPHLDFTNPWPINGFLDN